MESNFFSGSENLYKYLVSIGLLMVVLTVYYPMRERQNLQVLRITLRSEMNCISYEIEQNQKNVDRLNYEIKNNKLSVEKRSEIFNQLKQTTNSIKLKQIKTESRLDEISVRKTYIIFYTILIIIFLPLGLILIVWGFLNWKKAKKNEDDKSSLEKTLLELQIKKAEKELN